MSSPSNSLREPALAWRTKYKGTAATYQPGE